VIPHLRVLLYSPDLDGHRQVYCERWARVLAERGHEVVIAASFSRVDNRELLPEFANLLNNGQVDSLDVGDFREHGLGIETRELTGLIKRVHADVTVLLEADDHLRLLSNQARRGGERLPGRRVGLFIRTASYRYATSPVPSLRVRLGWLRRVPADWPEWPKLFHEWLLPRHDLLDVALCLDEYFVRERRGRYRWMPDLYEPSQQEDSRVAADGLVGAVDDDGLAAQLRSLAAAHDGQNLLVYYGTAYARRGYDTLLRLAALRDACFVHCGRRNDDDSYEFDVAGLRNELRLRGDLFETERFVSDFGAANALFSTANSVVLPYRRHLGSSGVMLQALAARRPVLVPDEGLMAARVRDHGLGAVYRAGDWDDLNRQHAALWARSPAFYAEAIGRFLRYFSHEQVERAIVAAVEGSADTCELPGSAT
jgi:glycosyltransferase involved in cell wall biosynthesis